MTDKQADIRESLAKITPGPWVIVNDLGVIWNTDGRVVLYSLDANEDPDNHDFIANAPEYVRRILDEVGRLQRGNDRKEKSLWEWHKIHNEMKDENEKLRKALEEIEEHIMSEVEFEGTSCRKIARKALEGKE